MELLKLQKWVSVKSSLFASARYEAERHQLYLRFRDGNVYRYFSCPLKVYTEFLSADSKGRYFSQNIRSQFRYEQVYGVSSVERPKLKLISSAV